MFLLAGGAVCVTGVAIVALFLISQKSVAVPWLVEVSDTNGIVSKPVRIERVRPSDAVIKAELARWATKVFTIDKLLTPRYFREANVMTKGLGEAQFTEFRITQNVVDRMAKDATLQRTLLDMSTTAQIKDSVQLGNHLLRQIGGVGRLHKPRVEQAGFAVLKAPDIPSVLVETAFISNPEEEEKLRSEAYQKQLTNALMRGILQYFSRNPPLARNRSI